MIPLALVGFLYGTMGAITSVSTMVALTGSHDGFLSAVLKKPERVLGLPDGFGSSEDRERVATRKAEALWARRGVLVPLAGASGVAALLILLGSLRATARGGRRSEWGRAAWQLGALIALPCLALESVVGYLHTRDLLAAVADLKDPISTQLRALLPTGARWVVLLSATSGVYLLATARYLSSAAVLAYFKDSRDPRRG